jgi:hypothetical protein
MAVTPSGGISGGGGPVSFFEQPVAIATTTNKMLRILNVNWRMFPNSVMAGLFAAIGPFACSD